jgi:hypothetical protein
LFDPAFVFRVVLFILKELTFWVPRHLDISLYPFPSHRVPLLNVSSSLAAQTKSQKCHNNFDLDLEGQEAEPGMAILLQISSILRIKDNKWQEYSRAEVEGLKEHLSDNKSLHNTGEFAIAKKKCLKRAHLMTLGMGHYLCGTPGNVYRPVTLIILLPCSIYWPA